MISMWFCYFVFLGMSAQVMADGPPKGALKNLSSDKFEVRSAAYAELEAWMKKNVKSSPALLHKVWRESEDPEVKTRCYVLMKQAVLIRQFGKGKGFVGIMMDPIVRGPMLQGGQPQGGLLKGDVQMGINIAQVLPNTPGQKAGLKAGDVIVGVDELDFNKLPEAQKKMDVRSLFQAYVGSKKPDDVITLHLLRAGKKVDSEVTLMKRPASADINPFGGSSVSERERAEREAHFEKWLRVVGGE